MPATDRFASLSRAPARARGAASCAAGAAAVLAALAIAGCGANERSPFAQVPSVVHRAELTSPPGQGRISSPLPRSAWRFRGLPWPASFVFDPAARPRRIHPELKTWFGSQPDTARITVLVGFHDPLRMPRLPVEALTSPDSTQRLLAQATSAQLLEALRARRRVVAREDSLWLANRFRAIVLERFWIVRAVMVSIRKDSLALLALEGRVTSLQPAVSHGPPPEDAPPTSRGRALIGLPPSSSLAALGYDLGPLALLDTGAERSYALLEGLKPAAAAAPDEPALDRYEYLTTTLNPDAVGDVHDGGHGTFSAAILVGTDARGPDFRGATRAHLAMYRTYLDAIGTPPASAALLRTLQSAADKAGVIGVEMQIDSGIEGLDSQAANQVSAGGPAVLAVVGNWNKDHLAAPGCARGVLAVGARAMGSNERASSGQSWNSSLAHVAKPELQAPTATGLPSLDDASALKPYSETSGALPYATAAAFVLRNWLADGGERVDAGQVYSALLACGDNPRSGVSPRFPLPEGVGLVNIPRSGFVWWGCLDVASFGVVEIPLADQPGGLSARYQAAIWWRDPPPFMGYPLHTDFDLALLAPDSPTVLAKSATSRGTFERFELVVPKGLWGLQPTKSPRLRITGGGLGLRPRRVYWTVIGRR